MGAINYLAPLLIALFLTACQVKEPKGNGGLISGHAPTTNKFTLQPLASKTYVANESISFTLTFPFEMEITGSPRLRLTIDGNTRYADYVPGADLKKLDFTYTFINGDNDNNGIDVAALELNGATLQFYQAGVLTNCDVATVTNSNFSGVKVDTQAPSITAFSLVNLPGLYHPGDKINFLFTFSEPIFVTGSPRFTMTLGSTDVEVVYVGGSNSTTLSFSYTITDSDADDADGYEFPNPIDVGAGSIKDSVGNNATLTFSGLVDPIKTHSKTVRVNGQVPYVIGATVPENGTYLSNKELSFVLEFNRSVNVTGSPYVEVTIGSNVRYASYLSGSGTEFLTFRYITIPGDVDLNGIEVKPSITRNGATIVAKDAPAGDFFADPLNNDIPFPSATGIIISAIQPAPISIARANDTTNSLKTNAPDDVWIIGQVLTLTLEFNTGVFVEQGPTPPKLPLDIGGETKLATYLSGGDGQTSLVFVYTIEQGDEDYDGSIGIGEILLNDGHITDASNTNATLTLPPPGTLTLTMIDGVRPKVDSVTPPANRTYSGATGANHINMEYTVVWDEAVNYSNTTAFINVDIGGVIRTFTRLNTPVNNNRTNITHRTSSLAGLNDSDGVELQSPLNLSTTVVRDVAGNIASGYTFFPTATPLVLVDTIPPKVTSIIPTTLDGTYKKDDIINFEVTFSEEVTITKSATYPRIQLDIGGDTNNYAIATSNSTGLKHNFSYTIPNNRTEDDGIVIKAVFQNAASFHARDAGLNPAVVDPALNDLATGIKIDTTAPTIASTAGTAAGTYKVGNTLQISLTYTEPVTVDTTGGTPFIPLIFTEGAANLNYESGSGTTTLIFSRELDPDHFAMDGLSASITAVTLNEGTIKDLVGNNAVNTFIGADAIDFSSVFITYPQVKLWVKNDFVNLAPAGNGVIVSVSGAASTEACGSSTCRVFNGDDKVEVDNMNNIRSTFMAIKMPTPVFPLVVEDTDSFDIFDIRAVLKGDNLAQAYDLATPNGASINGSGSATNHDLNFAPGSTKVLQTDFDGAHNFSGVLIPTTFTGAIGEVIAVENGLDGDQKALIKDYLESRY